MVTSKSVKLQRPAHARNGQPVVDCAYGYQNENQEEADEVEENCEQEGDEEEGSSKKGGGENEGRRQEDDRRENGERT